MMYKMGISNTMSYRQGLRFLLLSLFIWLHWVLFAVALVVAMGWHLSYLFSGLHFLLYHCIMRTFSQSHIPSAPRPASLTLEEVLSTQPGD